MKDTLIQYDKDLFLFLNGLGTPAWDGFWMFMTDKWSAIPLYVILLVLVYRKYQVKGTLILLVAVALLITCTDQLSNFFKYGFARPRPCYDLDLSLVLRQVKGYCGGQYGFFSAHAANAMGVGIFFFQLFRDNRRYFAWFLLLWAVMVGYSRIYIGVHYPLDVLAGMAVGTTFGWIFSGLYTIVLRKTA
ncbi:phosphatase PAP2 family protein [Zeaxanthinibacter enoshimensis]|uniref:Undecaprenyl-diphosphatase n=1 Tax=Zeaxanthinibacter enoshimensis TaxID=392009 RepID=A0A4R6TJ08_9FLAO|nr:phosphatase PAP2 family protein [Zeaxanthinibacter enoshimensis]TDQ29260.1 undecaprenyl-diphosphatase [Zeaxanthinibacter enoshimensis]